MALVEPEKLLESADSSEPKPRRPPAHESAGHATPEYEDHAASADPDPAELQPSA